MKSFAEKALYSLDFGNLVLVMGIPDDTGMPNMGLTKTQKALVNSLESRDWKHFRTRNKSIVRKPLSAMAKKI